MGARVVCGTSILAFISCACRRNPCKSASHTKRRSRIDAPAKADIVVLHGAATRYDEQLRAFSRISRSIEKRTTKSTSTLFPDDRLNLSFVRKKMESHNEYNLWSKLVRAFRLQSCARVGGSRGAKGRALNRRGSSRVASWISWRTPRGHQVLWRRPSTRRRAVVRESGRRIHRRCLGQTSRPTTGMHQRMCRHRA